MATTTSTTSLASPGVGSGLDVTGIVGKLMEVEKRPLTLMDKQISTSQSKIASAGFANTSDTVGTGSLTFDFGTFDGVAFASSGTGAKTVTIGAGQSSL